MTGITMPNEIYQLIQTEIGVNKVDHTGFIFFPATQIEELVPGFSYPCFLFSGKKRPLVSTLKSNADRDHFSEGYVVVRFDKYEKNYCPYGFFGYS